MTKRIEMKSVLSTIIAVGLALTPMTAVAGHNDGPSQSNDQDHLGWANVVHATAVYKRVRVVTPETECWTERVAYQRRDRRQASPVPMILGATMGGLLGHRIGHRGHHKRGGTVVGAIVGGAIAHQIERSNRQRRARAYRDGSREYRDQERCETSEKITWEDQLRGYDVVYRYKGREYQTHMSDAPGDRLRVVINVVPAQ